MGSFIVNLFGISLDNSACIVRLREEIVSWYCLLIKWIDALQAETSPAHVGDMAVYGRGTRQAPLSNVPPLKSNEIL